jgi:ParB-like chromosome segregation protein Spo0J
MTLEHFPVALEPFAFLLADLKPDPNNARLHNAKNLDAIQASLTRFGWRSLIVVRRSDNTIVAGHGRVESAKALGWTHCPVMFVDDDVSTARAYAIADNRTAELATWDLSQITDQLEAFDDEALAGLGFDGEDVENLLDQKVNPFVTTRVDIETLRPHPRNYQKHPADQIKHLQASIAAHGYYRNVVIARDGTILAGHGVVEASRAMGKKRVPVVRLDVAPDDPRALKVLTSDNEISNLAEVDDRGLTELLRDIMGSDPLNLDGTGFDAEKLAALTYVTRPESEIRDKQQAADWVGLPGYEAPPGRHKIIVSFDSAEDRDAFMELIGATIINKKVGEVWTLWWPERERQDLKSVKWVRPEPAK